ncbi:transposase [Citrobacter sp. L55]|uniref:IS66-like element accessory protein TnpA n=1 Tax=Citrobacter sp. L55 TaxID=1981983 RepID=UPI000C77C5AF|nr:IS66-like element accessory protein TnpA [Citrobacter sp. L55]PLC60285.1 transposase [Citrobacter sp. L55]
MKYRTLLPEALRLHFDEHLPRLEVGRRLGIPKSTICDFFARFAKHEISWPLPVDMRPEKLASLLYPGKDAAHQPQAPEPVFPEEPAVRKRPRRPNFPREFKIALAEKALAPGANVALLAREHGINDNLLFNWRNLYKRGLLRPHVDTPLLLPVTLTETERVAEQPTQITLQPSVDSPCCELELPFGTLRIKGQMTPELLRMLIGEIKAGAQ